jgi:hypothetical protein
MDYTISIVCTSSTVTSREEIFLSTQLAVLALLTSASLMSSPTIYSIGLRYPQDQVVSEEPCVGGLRKSFSRRLILAKIFQIPWLPTFILSLVPFTRF